MDTVVRVASAPPLSVMESTVQGCTFFSCWEMNFWIAGSGMSVATYFCAASMSWLIREMPSAVVSFFMIARMMSCWAFSRPVVP